MTILLINAVGKQLIEELGCEAYEEHSNNLVLGGFSGSNAPTPRPQAPPNRSVG
jgi:hypothetical protein